MADTTDDNLTFEQALERLESVVRDLESNETGLDKSLERYEDGVRLLKRCRAILDEAEQKIRLLTGVDADGNPVTVPFDGTSTAERDAANNREPAEKPKRNTERAPRRAAKERPVSAEDLF
jgi:exodeoxyribonuclease VII small subunit